MWMADLNGKSQDDDGRIRYSVVFHDDTGRKLPPVSYFSPNVRAQVIARVAVLNAQDTVKPDDISVGPIDLTPIVVTTDPSVTAKLAYLTVDAQLRVALDRQSRGWPNDATVADLQAQIKAGYTPEFEQ